MLAGLKDEDLVEREQNIKDNKEAILYSKRYSDEEFEFRYLMKGFFAGSHCASCRHVILPKAIARWVPAGKLMTEDEWRDLGVMQSPGWVHYMIHAPEPHILLFKRIKDSDPPQPENPQI